ncbi:hypothetical protein AMECASPLE_035017 [Ameca splendens]|uniref:Uncharacterized protein n=1 Tax=Ameca splendens TaxID=208324 RepID=A0ABV0XK98_9TELE
MRLFSAVGQSATQVRTNVSFRWTKLQPIKAGLSVCTVGITEEEKMSVGALLTPPFSLKDTLQVCAEILSPNTAWRMKRMRRREREKEDGPVGNPPPPPPAANC